MKLTKWCSLIGLFAGMFGGAAYGYFDDSEPAPILSPGYIACFCAGFFAPLGLIAGFFFGFLIDSLNSENK
jgi:hypothetical protein